MPIALLLLLLAVLSGVAQASYCPSLTFSTTTAQQTIMMDGFQGYATILSCGAGGGTAVNAYVIHFTPPESGNYYVKINKPIGGVAAVMEIRQGSCNGYYLACNVGLTTTSSVGWDSIYLNAYEEYTILVAADSDTMALPYNNLVVVGKRCPMSYSLNMYTSSPQSAYFYSSTSVRGHLSCANDASEQTMHMISYTPVTTGNHYVRVNNVDAYGGIAALEIRNGKCSATEMSSVVYCGTGSTKVGTDSVLLMAGQQYTILLGVSNGAWYSLAEPNLLEVGLTDVSSSSTCTDNPASATTLDQSAMTSSLYSYNTNLACDSFSSGNTASQYLSFTPPSSGNYRIRISNPTPDIVMEIRTYTCNGASVGCNDAIAGTFDTGFDSIYLTGGVTYVLLIAPYYSTSSLSNLYIVNIGLASNSGNGGSFYSVTYAAALAYNGIVLGVTLGLFFIAMIIAIVFCCIGGQRINGDLNLVTPRCTCCCGTSALAKIRKVAIATWLFSMWVWLTNWTVLWSAAGYPLAFATSVLAAIIHSSATSEQAFMYSTAARNASLYKTLLIACGVLLLLNMVVCCVQVGVLFSEISWICSTSSVYGSAYDPACYAWLMIIPSYGVVCAVGMVVLAGLAMDLGITLNSIVERAKMEQTGGGNGVVISSLQSRDVENVMTQAPMYTGGQIIGPPKQ